MDSASVRSLWATLIALVSNILNYVLSGAMTQFPVVDSHVHLLPPDVESTIDQVTDLPHLSQGEKEAILGANAIRRLGLDVDL